MLISQQEWGKALAFSAVNKLLFPKEPQVYKTLADVYKGTNNKEMVVESYRKALELNPKDKATETKLQSLLKKG